MRPHPVSPNYYCTKLIIGVDPVTGIPAYLECSRRRSGENHCGREGKDWEPIPVKPSFWSRLFSRKGGAL